MELDVLSRIKHDNIISLVGYCDETDKKIIVYEHETKGSLSKYLNDASLTWMKRLKICIDIATGLYALHTPGVVTEDKVTHRGIKSSIILLNGDWKAKISNLELSSRHALLKKNEHVVDNAYDTLGYLAPEYKYGFLDDKSDIYSLGVVLFEILCGRLAWQEGCENHNQYLGPLAKRSHEEGKLDEMVFEGIKEHIDPQSLSTFQEIAIQCLEDSRRSRPSTSKVVTQLTKALEFQEDREIWKPKLPRDYKELFKMSEIFYVYESKMKKDLYKELSGGILLHKGKVLFSLGSNGERNEMISARKFTYKKGCARNWQSIPQSRFKKVVEMFIVSKMKMNIKIKIKTQFLSPGVNYGAHLVFKLCSPSKSSSEPMYVNLTYKMEGETFHSYFATRRDEEWMMIELYRFLNHKKDTNFEVMLESFSPHYRGSGIIHIEGIEFRVIDNVEHEEIDKEKEVHQVQKSKSNMDEMLQLPTTELGEIFVRSENNDDGDKMLSQNEVNKKKDLVLSAMETFCMFFANVKLFNVKPSAESRFQEVIEFLPRQVFCIDYQIESEILSPNTDYMCYLVFKLSQKCRGLHCPVKVKNLLHRKKKEIEVIYFRTPCPRNLHHTIRVPEKREDGWMEVIVLKFNSNSWHRDDCIFNRDDCIPINLKFITYEGTMSGLIVCGLEIRPM